MSRWPLTGRTEEIHYIANAIASDGACSGVVLSGPAGVGKTRLAHEAASRARERGSAVRWAIGTAAAKAVPMGVLAEWADRVDGNPLRLVDQVIETLTTEVGGLPLLLVIDDAHLIDELSAFVVQQLVVRGVVSVVATLRSGEVEPPAVSALWQQGCLRRLDLQPLTQAETERLLQSVLGGPVSADCVTRLWELTVGNVLYLRQLVAQERHTGRLAERNGVWHWDGHLEITPSLIDLVELHIGADLGAVQDVVDLVAATEPVERACLAEVAEQAAIEDAERRGLITATADGTGLLRMGHPLYGEVRLARAGRFRLQRLRGKLAAALAARPDADPVRVGLLWLESDLDPDQAVFLRAAEQAVVRLDLVLGERLARSAMEAGSSVEGAILCAHLLVLLNRGEEADRILTGITGPAVPEAVLANALHLRVANLLWPLARPDEAWQITETAVQQSSSPLLKAHVQAVRAVQLAMAGRPADAAAAMDGVDRDVLQVLPAMVALWALTIAAGDLGDPVAAQEYAGEGYRRAAAAPEAAYQGVGIAEFHVCALTFAGLLTAACEVADRTMERCAEAPGISRSVAAAVKGMAALFAGDLDVSVECLGSACEVFEAYGDTTGIFYRFSIVYTEALARAGRIGEALRMQAKMHAARHPTFQFAAPDAALADAWVAAACGRMSSARGFARRGADLARSSGQRAREIYCLQVSAQLGDTRRTNAARLEGLVDSVAGPRARLAARYARALTDDEADSLVEVSAELAAIGDHLAAADAAAHAAAAFARRGRRGSALTAAERASAITSSRGAANPSALTVVGGASLTAREREVTLLLAEGLSNKDIAAELDVSVRTVENHILRACARLGVAGRQELAARVAQHPPRHDAS